MNSGKIFALVAIAAGLMASSSTLPASAGQSQTMSVKMGYFNLTQVKSQHPASAGLDRLENNARELLRADAEKGNALLVQMQKDGKSADEVKAKAQELQLQLNAKMEATMTLLNGNRNSATSEILQAVNTVAKDKGLDVVVDANGVFSGGDKVVNSAEDVTDAVIQKLVPSAARPESKH